jgi:hypothetical protein
MPHLQARQPNQAVKFFPHRAVGLLCTQVVPRREQVAGVGADDQPFVGQRVQETREMLEPIA